MQKRLIFDKTEVAQLLITKKADIANFKREISCNKATILRKRCDFFIYHSNKSYNHQNNF